MTSKEILWAGTTIAEGFSAGISEPPSADVMDMLRRLAEPIELTCTCTLDADLLDHIVGEQKDPTFDIGWKVAYPARPHRKRRIRKKWIKRYGWKEEMLVSPGWKVSECSDGSIEIKKRLV